MRTERERGENTYIWQCAVKSGYSSGDPAAAVRQAVAANGNLARMKNDLKRSMLHVELR